MSVDNRVEKPVDEVLKAPGRRSTEEFIHLVHSDSTLAAALKGLAPNQLARLSTNPHALLLLIHKYLNTEEARPFLLSEEVEAAMQKFCGVPDAVRRSAGLLVLVGRFHAGDHAKEGSVPR